MQNSQPLDIYGLHFQASRKYMKTIFYVWIISINTYLKDFISLRKSPKSYNFLLHTCTHSHIIYRQRTPPDSPSSIFLLQKLRQLNSNSVLPSSKRSDGPRVCWLSQRWVCRWQRGAQDGLDMVLSMSARLPWRWQSLIMSSQFVKQKEQAKVERGDGRWNSSKWRRRNSVWRLKESSVVS